MAVRDENFRLTKSTNIRRLDIDRNRIQRLQPLQNADFSRQIQALNYQRQAGLRDIGQSRQEGAVNVVRDSLRRGIFNSGIKQENIKEVNREAGEARRDLRANISNAVRGLQNQRGQTNINRNADLSEISNQRNYWEKLQLAPLSGGGSNPFAGFLQALQDFFDFIETRDQTLSFPYAPPPDYTTGAPG